jgi:SAM-dependent methyltransferase
MIDRLVRVGTGILTRARERLLGRQRPRFRVLRELFAGKVGLEIGGPSAVFKAGECLPVYPHAARVDGVNFAGETLWEGKICEGMTYRYADDKLGRQYIGEASDLGAIPDASYDFVLSSHSLEHSANPLKCVAEWVRVLKPGGALLLVVPDAHMTFDHRRGPTPFAHLLDDYQRGVGEDDLTHMDEILALHDLSMDPAAGDLAAFRARSLRNAENRALHQHVFDAAVVAEVLGHFGIRVCYTDAVDLHIIALGTTQPVGKSSARNEAGTCAG